MKTKVFIRVMAAVAVLLFSTGKSIACAPPKYAHNNKTENGLVVEKEIYKRTSDGKYLEKYRKLLFSYDGEKRVSKKEVLQWDIEKNAYRPHSVYTYYYMGSTCSIELAVYGGDKIRKTERYVYTGYSYGDIQFAECRFFQWDENSNTWISSDKKLNNLLMAEHQ